MNKPNGTNKKSSHGDTPNKPPLPPRPPGIDGDEGDHEEGGAGKRKKQINYTDKPPHWGPPLEAICAVLLVFITGTYTYYASQQACANITAANAAASSAKTAAKTLELDRPYISVDLQAGSELGYNANGGYLKFVSEIKNHGRTPALNAKIDVGFLPDSPDPVVVKNEATSFCKNLIPKSGNSQRDQVFRSTYFPDVPSQGGWIEQFAPNYFGTGGILVDNPTVVACVSYQSPFSDEWLYTSKIYRILRKDPSSPNGIGPLFRGKTIPKDEVVLFPDIISEASK